MEVWFELSREDAKRMKETIQDTINSCYRTLNQKYTNIPLTEDYIRILQPLSKGLRNALKEETKNCEGSAVSQDIFEVKFKDVKLYQTIDQDGDPMGIVATLVSPEDMEAIIKAYNEYYEKAVENDEDIDPSADGLVEFMTKNGYPAGRVYLEDEIVLP